VQGVLKGRRHCWDCWGSLCRTVGCFEIFGIPISVLKMKYVLVTGGVVSGLGKGVTASSIGLVLKACGLRVTSIKIDPYLNTDAGTMSPFEHGEVFVLDDGGEVPSMLLAHVVKSNFVLTHHPLITYESLSPL